MNVSKYLTDTAVFWEKTGKNGFYELTLSTGVEINVRWEDRNELFINYDGKEEYSGAIVYIKQDMSPDDFLYLGELTDLSAEEQANPKLEQSAFAIKKFEKIKSVGGRSTLRRVFLSKGGN